MRWSEQDIKFLSDNHEVMPHQDVADHLGRTLSAVSARLVKLRMEQGVGNKYSVKREISPEQKRIQTKIALGGLCRHVDCQSRTEGRYCETHARQVYARDMTPVPSHFAGYL